MLVLNRAGSAFGHICVLALVCTCCWSGCWGGFGRGVLPFASICVFQCLRGRSSVEQWIIPEEVGLVWM